MTRPEAIQKLRDLADEFRQDESLWDAAAVLYKLAGAMIMELEAEMASRAVNEPGKMDDEMRRN